MSVASPINISPSAKAAVAPIQWACRRPRYVVSCREYVGEEVALPKCNVALISFTSWPL